MARETLHCLHLDNMSIRVYEHTASHLPAHCRGHIGFLVRPWTWHTSFSTWVLFPLPGKFFPHFLKQHCFIMSQARLRGHLTRAASSDHLIQKSPPTHTLCPVTLVYLLGSTYPCLKLPCLFMYYMFKVSVPREEASNKDPVFSPLRPQYLK